jgi:hypothetical protein
MSVEPGDELEVVEEVEGVVVTSAAPPLPERRSVRQIVAAHGALAATGFVAGAATAVVVAHRRARRTAQRNSRLSRNGGNGSPLEISASRSFLVDVHLLNRRP